MALPGRNGRAMSQATFERRPLLRGGTRLLAGRTSAALVRAGRPGLTGILAGRARL